MHAGVSPASSAIRALEDGAAGSKSLCVDPGIDSVGILRIDCQCADKSAVALIGRIAARKPGARSAPGGASIRALEYAEESGLLTALEKGPSHIDRAGISWIYRQRIACR